MRLKKVNTHLRHQLQKTLVTLKTTKSREEFAEAAADYVSGYALAFVQTQINMFQKKPKGRRYTMPLRRLALSIYFRNARVYTFLRKVFALPSFTILREYAKQFDNGVGWSDFAFKVLKEKLEHLTDKDKVCAISLDAMELGKGIAYNAKRDIFDGFEDLGPHGRSKLPATQAVVFMVT